MKYLKKIVLTCIILCAAYLPAYFLCAKLGIELPDSLTESWYRIFGTELAAAALIKIAEVISEKLTRKKEETQ